ncbi:MAG: cytochrome P450 [Acidimicrobiia bacterium]
MVLATTSKVSEVADGILSRLLTTREGQADPYPLYRQLRDLAPLHHSALDRNWYASGFEACRAILGDSRFGKGETLFASRHGMDEARVESAMRRRRPSMILVDPPEHSRLRGVAKAAFVPSRMEQLAPRVAALVEDRLDVLAEAGEADVMAELAFPLPITVIGELVGVPPEDRGQFRPLLDDIMGADRPDPSAEATAHAEEAFDALQAYFGELIAERRARPQEDLLSSLVAAEGRGELSADELYGTVTLIFIAGFITTTNLIGSGLTALFRHPQEQAALWSDPSLVSGAVEEMLRFDTPVQMVHRVAREDVEIDGAHLSSGETVFTLLAAANRDPGRFPDPDRFEVTRADNFHLAFAWGNHFCLGAHLARLEGRLVFDGLVRRFATVEPAGEPVRRPGLFIRGLESLPVRVRPH